MLSYVIMSDRKLKAAKAAFDTSVDCGITFFDTAEVYGSRVRKIFDFTCFVYIPIYVDFLQMSFGAISSETLLGR